VEYWKGLTGDRVDDAPFQDVDERFLQVSGEEFAAAVKLILLDGEARSGAHAVVTALAAEQAMDAMVVRSGSRRWSVV